MILSKFIYDDGSWVSFTPSYAPVKKTPIDPMSAIRHDSFTTTGKKQAVLERIDNLVPLDFPVVPAGELNDWARLMTYALGGGIFSYHPDSTSSTHADYTLESMDWKPVIIAPGIYTFSFVMRRWVGTEPFSS